MTLLLIFGAFAYFLIGLGYFVGCCFANDYAVVGPLFLAIAWPIHVLITLGIALGAWTFGRREQYYEASEAAR